MAAIIMWSIWKSRNNTIFKDEEYNINGIITRAKRMSKEWELKNKIDNGANTQGKKEPEKQYWLNGKHHLLTMSRQTSTDQ